MYEMKKFFIFFHYLFNFVLTIDNNSFEFVTFRRQMGKKFDEEVNTSECSTIMS